MICLIYLILDDLDHDLSDLPTESAINPHYNSAYSTPPASCRLTPLIHDAW